MVTRVREDRAEEYRRNRAIDRGSTLGGFPNTLCYRMRGTITIDVDARYGKQLSNSPGE